MIRSAAKEENNVLVAEKSSAIAASASIIERSYDIFGFALCLFLYQEIQV